MQSQFYYSKVLLVDDSEIDNLVNRRLIQLTHFASDIITTSNGEDALHFLKEECASAAHAPDFIFLDMNLPMMSGYDFIEEFKKLPDYIRNKTKIIVLSVFQKQEKLNKVLAYDFVAGQLEKPLGQQALKELAKKSVVRLEE
jgi:CheY-like chemotaxis protein